MPDISEYGRQLQIGDGMWVEIAPGGEYRIHPEGGIVLIYPGRARRWCRVENGSYKSSDLPQEQKTAIRLLDQPINTAPPSAFPTPPPESPCNS